MSIRRVGNQPVNANSIPNFWRNCRSTQAQYISMLQHADLLARLASSAALSDSLAAAGSSSASAALQANYGNTAVAFLLISYKTF